MSNLLKTLDKMHIIKIHIHRWSHIATIFNSSPPVSKGESHGLFKVSELRNPEGFKTLQHKCDDRINELISEAVSPNRNRLMAEVLDEMSDTLCKVADLSEFIRIAHPNKDFRKAAENTTNTISGLVEKLNTNSILYAALKKVIDNGDILPTTEVDKHLAKMFAFDFEQTGIHLPEADRIQLVEIINSILSCGQQFVCGASRPTVVEKRVLPKEVSNILPAVDDHVVLTGVCSDSANPLVRQYAYKIFLSPCEHQERLLTDLLQQRYSLAKICGYTCYKERALKDSLAETGEFVDEFLSILARQLKDRADEDLFTMNIIKQEEKLDNDTIQVWDVPYYMDKIKKDWCKVLVTDYSPYFSLGACMEGLNTLMTHLYGISFNNVETFPGETWDSKVYKLEVVHESEGLLGFIYCDFFERLNKPCQDCHFTIVGGKDSNGSYQTPVVVVVLNIPSSGWFCPPLLAPLMVNNLFHEMGHAMHSMLGRTKYQHTMGTRCSTDFAEVPSILMEYFASDPRVLKTFARHFQTNESIPDDMLNKLVSSKQLFMATDIQTQVFHSLLDQAYHGYHPLPGTTTEILADIQNKHCSLPYVKNTAWQLRFTHLYSYGAKYYSYLMSRAIASWIWETYFEANPLNRSSGERYRRECLAYGGSKPPRQLVSDFLKRKVTPFNLAESLINEVDVNKVKIRM